jgi:hypothetical protein
MSPGEMTDGIHKVAITALAAGWISAAATIQSRVLERIVSADSNPHPRSSRRHSEGGQK